MNKEKEEDKKVPAAQESDEATGQPSAYRHAAFLLESLQELSAPTAADLAQIVESIVELLNQPDVQGVRGDLNTLANLLARRLSLLPGDEPVTFLAQTLAKAPPLVRDEIRGSTAYRVAKFLAIVASSLKRIRRLQPPPKEPLLHSEENQEFSEALAKSPRSDPQPTPETGSQSAPTAPEVKVESEAKVPPVQPPTKEEIKQSTVGANKAPREPIPAEAWGLLLSTIETLLLKAGYLNDWKLRKIARTVKSVVRLATIKVTIENLKEDTPEVLLKIFLSGLSKRLEPALRKELLEKFVATAMTDTMLAQSEKWLRYYRPLMETVTGAEIEDLLAPTMLLLLRRSTVNFFYIAPILLSFGPISCQSLSLLLQTTLHDFLHQEGTSSEQQDLLLEVLTHLAPRLTNAAQPSAFLEIVKSFTPAWKEQLEVLEVEAQKQLNLVRILAMFFSRSKMCPLEGRTTLLRMILELFAVIKQEQAATEAALAIAVALPPAMKLTPTLANVIDAAFMTTIYEKALTSSGSKDLMAALLYPTVHDAATLVYRPEGLGTFLPSMALAAWKQQIGQLNLNAVTQASYNIAVAAIQFALLHRDAQGKAKEDEKTRASADAALLKFATSPQSNISARDYVSQKNGNPLGALLHIDLLTLVAVGMPGFVETQCRSVMPMLAGILLEYSLSSRCSVRETALQAVKAIFEDFLKNGRGELARSLAQCYQMATYAFVRATPLSKNFPSPSDFKQVLLLQLTMHLALKDTGASGRQSFWRIFILMHNRKLCGRGSNRRLVCNCLLEVMRKRLGDELKQRLTSDVGVVLSSLTSGMAIMEDESALLSRDQVQSTINVIETLARAGLGLEVVGMCRRLLNHETLEAAEQLEQLLTGPEAERISRFEIEFLVDEIGDLGELTRQMRTPGSKQFEKDAEAEKEKEKEEKKTSKGSKKPRKETKKPAPKPPKVSKEESLSKEELLAVNRRTLALYSVSIANRARAETKSVLEFISALSKAWNSKELLQSALSSGLLEEVKEVLKLRSVRFEGYQTLRKLLGTLRSYPEISRDAERIVDAYFAAAIASGQHQSIKSCTRVFESLATCRIEGFDERVILVILDIAEYLIDSQLAATSMKSRALDWMIKVLLETGYNVAVVHRITPIVVKLMKSSYYGDNLQRLLQAFLNVAIFYDIYDVANVVSLCDPSHLLILLQSLFAVKRPLPQAPWMSNLLLLHIFNENRDIAFTAKALLNERCLSLGDVLVPEARSLTTERFAQGRVECSSLVKMLNAPAKDLRDSAVRAISGYLEISGRDTSLGLQLFIQEYDYLESICKDTIADLVTAISHQLSAADLQPLFRFLLTKGVAQGNGRSKCYMECGIQIIQNQGREHAGVIILAIEEVLSHDSKLLTDNARTIAVIFIGHAARYLATNDPKLPQLYKRLQGMLTLPADSVRIAAANCLAYFASIFRDDAKAQLLAALQALQKKDAKKPDSTEEIKTRAYAIAGYVKGLGVRVVDEHQIGAILAEPFKEKPSDNPVAVARKESTLYVYSALSSVLGRSFEFFTVGCMPHILESFASGKETVREAAKQASKTMLSRLTSQGVKTVLPSLIRELESGNWRSKLAAVECLGSMAYLAPKQLSNCLPQIVSNIKGVLNEAQPRVHQAGIQALTAIGSVIKNPEIADISGKLIQALKNPTRELLMALDILLQQTFAHAIDAPSLSLIIPILDYGLRAQNNDVKMKATQLVANICRLLADPQDMLPYLVVIVPALKMALVDAIPEVRGASARALGALCKGLGLNNMQEVLGWIKNILAKEGAPAERSGAAQAYAEVIAAHGTKFLDGLIDELLDCIRDKSPAVREGYLGLFLFLPVAFGEGFENYFSLVLPVALGTLKDPDELVRGAANRVVQICIRQFGQKRSEVLIGPLLEKMMDPTWKIRESALTLMSDMLMVLENDMTRSEPRFITIDDKSRILATIFIMRYDGVDSIQVTAAQVWKALVDNQPRALKAIMPWLLALILDLVAKRTPQLREISILALKDLAEKYGEKLMADILNIIRERLELDSDDRYVTGICVCVDEMLTILDAKIITDNKAKIYAMLEPFTTPDDDLLRASVASILFNLMQKDLDNDFQHQIARQWCQRLLQFERDGELEKATCMQDIISRIVARRPKFGDNIIRLFGDEPFSPMKLSTFKCMAKYLVTAWFPPSRHKHLLDKVFRATQQDPVVAESAIDCLARASDVVTEEDDRQKWVQSLLNSVSASPTTRQKRAFLKLVIHMFKDIKEPAYAQYGRVLYDIVVTFITSPEEDIPLLTIETIAALTSAEAKENHHGYVAKLKQEIDLHRAELPNDLLPLFANDQALSYLLPLFQNTLMHGNVDLRVDAATVYRYAVELTSSIILKPHAAKMAGSLIRVVNDKFPPELKNELLKAACVLMRKCGPAVRAFVSPLQTSFMKALNDPELSAPLRPVLLECTTELLKLVPKADSFRTELCATIESANLAAHPTAFGALAIILKTHGSTLKPEVRSGLLTQFNNYFVKSLTSLSEDIVAAWAFAMTSLCFSSPEATAFFELPTTKVPDHPALHAYFYYALLFAPFNHTEVGGKFLAGLRGKIKIASQDTMARLLTYTRYFIHGAKPETHEELFALLDEWIITLTAVDWVKAGAMLALIPFSEWESGKMASEKYLRLKYNTLSYIALRCPLEAALRARDIVRQMFEPHTELPKALAKLQESKALGRDVVTKLLILLR